MLIIRLYRKIIIKINSHCVVQFTERRAAF